MNNLSLLILASLGAATLSADAVTFSFLTDTWTNGASTQTGYLNGATSGTLTKEGITFSFSTSFAGTAVSGTRNLEKVTNENPFGFNLATQTDANDLSQVTGSLINYQRWDFVFSEDIVITTLGVDDIDSNIAATNGVGKFRDAAAIEGFTTAVPGPTGSGIDPTISLNGTTHLIQGTLAAGSGSVNYVISDNGTQPDPNNDPDYRAFFTFGSTAIRSFSIYAFSDRPTTHRQSLFGGSFEVAAVPEASVALFGLLGLPLLWKRRRQA